MVKTQAPYTISENRDFDVKLRDKNRCAIGVIYTRQDAELIHAVLNAHDGLVAALKTARVALEHDVPSGCWSTGPYTGNAYKDLVVCPGCNAISQIDAALAGVKGE